MTQSSLSGGRDALAGWRLWAAVAALWLAGFAAFSNSFTIAFQFDDLHTVQSNAYVRSLAYVPRYFVDATTYSYRPENSGYRPMASLACALGFQLSRNETWGYHLIKLLEHCLAATLIMLLALRLLPRRGAVAETPGLRSAAAFLGGLIFVVHRANTETVDYITAISTLQAGLFDLLAFLFYLKFRERAKAPLWPRLALAAAAVLSFEAAMMSKEEGITLPAVLLAYEWIYGRRPEEGYLACLRANWRRWAGLLAPFVAAAVVYVALRTLIQPAVADTSRGNVPRFNYFITQFRSWIHYWTLFVWPVRLNSDNLAFEFSQGLDDPRFWGALVANLVIWWGAWKLGRRWRFVLFAVAWAYITVSPASSFFPLVEAVNEHRMYIPYMMLAPLAAWGLLSGALRAAKAIGSSPAVGRALGLGAAALISLALGYGAHARNEVWQTELSLWEDVYAKNPDSPRALNVLGITLLNNEQWQRGLSLLERCHTLAPGYLPCMVHLSIGYAHFHRFEEGLKILMFGRALNPDYPHLNFHLGIYYKDYLGRPDEAIPYLKHVIELTEGRFFQATIKLADIHLDKGDYNEAARLANSVLALDRSNGDAWAVIGRVQLQTGHPDLAGQIFRRLTEAAPQATRYYLDLGNWQERTGDLRKALASFETVAARNPNAIQAYEGVARIAGVLGDQTKARQAAFAVAALKTGGNWELFTSVGLKGERPGRTAP